MIGSPFPVDPWSCALVEGDFKAVVIVFFFKEEDTYMPIFKTVKLATRGVSLIVACLSTARSPKARQL